MIGEMVRTPEEIKELAQEVREHVAANSQQFAQFTFEEGIQAVLKWLFYKHEPLPTTFKKPNHGHRYTDND
jgi:vacuolar-type H+-ATPase subunit D/Vma8